MRSNHTRVRLTSSIALLAIAMIACPCLAPPRTRATDSLKFGRDVLPILSDKCFYCHGPDESHRQADLRLDTHAGALRSLTPGHPEKSELVRRISSPAPDERMPPPDSNKSLTERERQILKQWIREGAEWGGHWAFEPLQPPALPDSGRLPAAASLNNWIDAYIQASLHRQGRTASPQADRRTLIRRATLDLTGLPPTPEAVEQFLSDNRPNAYARLVERLLASPAYGERMAWNWLDAARYADSNGYQGDRERTMWPWRDWVVRAFNENLPFDDFTRWQLAGDLLPSPTFEQRLATGFCRNHMINGEGGRIPEENRVDYVMDMAETMGTIWLGLTLNCCRCHDHKFDPLKQREYYQLSAFFNQTPVTGGGGDPQTPPVLAAPTKNQRDRQAGLDRSIAEVTAALETRRQQLQALQSEWETRHASKPAASDWLRWAPERATAQHQSLKILDDRSVLASGDNPANDTYVLLGSVKSDESDSSDSPVTAIRLEALKDKSHTEGSLSRSGSGNFVITSFEAELLEAGQPPRRIPFSSAAATFQQNGFSAEGLLDDKSSTGWAVYEGRVVDRPHAAMLLLKTPMAWPANAQLRITLRHASNHHQHNAGRVRISWTHAPRPSLDEAPSWRQFLRIAQGKRTADQQSAIAAAHREQDGEHQKLAAKLAALTKQRKDLEASYARVMVMQDQTADKYRSTFVLDRGLYNKPLDEVVATVPKLLPPLPPLPPQTRQHHRLDLANWLTSPTQPLTARVTANRIWQQLFGMGLVKTTEDFGVQGEHPTHPQLLDALAWELQQSDWDLKALIRTIVLSHTYRQTAAATPDALDWDPQNRWLARGPRFRLPSWMLRDQALAAAGLLVSTHGGRAVHPYQPEGVWEEATFGNKKYTQDHGASLYRRSLYTFWRRIIGPTMFFDNASRQTCTVKSFRTNTPLHALLTLNDITYVEAARVLSGRVLAIPNQSDRARLDTAMRRLLARPATDQEAAILLDAMRSSKRRYTQQPADAEALLSHGDYPRRADLNLAEHAAWTSVCLALLNLDETLTKE